MDGQTVLYGIAAILTTAAGCALVIREFRRRERRACQRDLDELADELHTVRTDFVNWRRWAFLARQQAADAGLDLDEPPQPRHALPDDSQDVTGEIARPGRRALRRLGRPHHGDGRKRNGTEHPDPGDAGGGGGAGSAG